MLPTTPAASAYVALRLASINTNVPFGSVAPGGEGLLPGGPPSRAALRRSTRQGVGHVPTHCCPWPSSRRTTGVPWNLTFDHAAEKASGGDSGRSRVASINRQEILAERLHPKAAYSSLRPRLCENAKVAETERLPILKKSDFFGAAT